MQVVGDELSLPQTLRRIFTAAKPELPLLAGAAVALVVSSGTALVFPKAVGHIVDTITPATEPNTEPRAEADARAALSQLSFTLGAMPRVHRMRCPRLALMLQSLDPQLVTA